MEMTLFVYAVMASGAGGGRRYDAIIARVDTLQRARDYAVYVSYYPDWAAVVTDCNAMPLYWDGTALGMRALKRRFCIRSIRGRRPFPMSAAQTY